MTHLSLTCAGPALLAQAKSSPTSYQEDGARVPDMRVHAPATPPSLPAWLLPSAPRRRHGDALDPLCLSPLTLDPLPLLCSLPNGARHRRSP